MATTSEPYRAGERIAFGDRAVTLGAELGRGRYAVVYAVTDDEALAVAAGRAGNAERGGGRPPRPRVCLHSTGARALRVAQQPHRVDGVLQPAQRAERREEVHA